MGEAGSEVGLTLLVSGRTLEGRAVRAGDLWTLSARYFPEISVTDRDLPNAKLRLELRLATAIKQLKERRAGARTAP